MKLINKIKCLTGHHSLITTRVVTREVKELYCRNCKKQFVIHTGVKAFLPLDEELKACNDFMLDGDLMAYMEGR